MDATPSNLLTPLWNPDNNKRLSDTIAGDLAVTNFIQGCLNYLFPNVTTELDNRLGKRLPWRRVINPPLGLVARVANLDGKKQQFWQTFVQSQDILQPKLTPKTLFKRLFFCILRGLFLSVFLFLLTWSIAVAIACPIYCGKNIGSTWAPQVRYGDIISYQLNDFCF